MRERPFQERRIRTRRFADHAQLEIDNPDFDPDLRRRLQRALRQVDGGIGEVRRLAKTIREGPTEAVRNRRFRNEEAFAERPEGARRPKQHREFPIGEKCAVPAGIWDPILDAVKDLRRALRRLEDVGGSIPPERNAIRRSRDRHRHPRSPDRDDDEPEFRADRAESRLDEALARFNASRP
jgi:hypothetical protein